MDGSQHRTLYRHRIFADFLEITRAYHGNWVNFSSEMYRLCPTILIPIRGQTRSFPWMSAVELWLDSPSRVPSSYTNAGRSWIQRTARPRALRPSSFPASESEHVSWTLVLARMASGISINIPGTNDKRDAWSRVNCRMRRYAWTRLLVRFHVHFAGLMVV